MAKKKRTKSIRLLITFTAKSGPSLSAKGLGRKYRQKAMTKLGRALKKGKSPKITIKLSRWLIELDFYVWHATVYADGQEIFHNTVCAKIDDIFNFALDAVVNFIKKNPTKRATT